MGTDSGIANSTNANLKSKTKCYYSQYMYMIEYYVSWIFPETKLVSKNE